MNRSPQNQRATLLKSFATELSTEDRFEQQVQRGNVEGGGGVSWFSLSRHEEKSCDANDKDDANANKNDKIPDKQSLEKQQDKSCPTPSTSCSTQPENASKSADQPQQEEQPQQQSTKSKRSTTSTKLAKWELDPKTEFAKAGKKNNNRTKGKMAKKEQQWMSLDEILGQAFVVQDQQAHHDDSTSAPKPTNKPPPTPPRATSRGRVVRHQRSLSRQLSISSKTSKKQASISSKTSKKSKRSQSKSRTNKASQKREPVEPPVEIEFAAVPESETSKSTTLNEKETKTKTKTKKDEKSAPQTPPRPSKAQKDKSKNVFSKPQHEPEPEQNSTKQDTLSSPPFVAKKSVEPMPTTPATLAETDDQHTFVGTDTLAEEEEEQQEVNVAVAGGHVNDQINTLEEKDDPTLEDAMRRGAYQAYFAQPEEQQKDQGNEPNLSNTVEKKNAGPAVPSLCPLGLEKHLAPTNNAMEVVAPREEETTFASKRNDISNSILAQEEKEEEPTETIPVDPQLEDAVLRGAYQAYFAAEETESSAVGETPRNVAREKKKESFLVGNQSPKITKTETNSDRQKQEEEKKEFESRVSASGPKPRTQLTRSVSTRPPQNKTLESHDSSRSVSQPRGRLAQSTLPSSTAQRAATPPTESNTNICAVSSAATSKTTRKVIKIIKRFKAPKVMVLKANRNRAMLANQQVAFAIMDHLEIPYDTIDGADPVNWNKRKKLCKISGLPEHEYPQFFSVHFEDRKIKFRGGWEWFQEVYNQEEGGLKNALLGDDEEKSREPSHQQ